AAELEDVPDLDAAVERERAAAARARVTGAHLGRLDRAVGDEVAPGDDVGGVLARLVRAGDPGRAGHHPRVDEVPDAEVLEDLRADVAAHQARVLGEVLGLEDLRYGGRERGLQPLEVDLA